MRTEAVEWLIKSLDREPIIGLSMADRAVFIKLSEDELVSLGNYRSAGNRTILHRIIATSETLSADDLFFSTLGKLLIVINPSLNDDDRLRITHRLLQNNNMQFVKQVLQVANRESLGLIFSQINAITTFVDAYPPEEMRARVEKCRGLGLIVPSDEALERQLMRRKLEHVEQKLASAQKENVSLSERYTAVVAERDGFQRELQAIKERFQQTNQTLLRTQQEQSGLMSRATLYQEKMAQTTLQLEAVRKQSEVITKQLEASMVRIDSLQKTLQSTEQALKLTNEIARKDQESLSSQIKNLTAEIADLKEAKLRSEQKVAEGTQQLNDCVHNLTMAREGLRVLELQNAQLREEQTNLQQLHETAQQRLMQVPLALGFFTQGMNALQTHTAPLHQEDEPRRPVPVLERFKLERRVEAAAAQAGTLGVFGESRKRDASSQGPAVDERKSHREANGARIRQERSPTPSPSA